MTLGTGVATTTAAAAPTGLLKRENTDNFCLWNAFPLFKLLFPPHAHLLRHPTLSYTVAFSHLLLHHFHTLSRPLHLINTVFPNRIARERVVNYIQIARKTRATESYTCESFHGKGGGPQDQHNVTPIHPQSDKIPVNDVVR